MAEEGAGIEDLCYLMARLRDPDSGCPWDLQQDFASIVPHTLEECYELVDTIERGDFEHLREELGDVLFQVIFYSRLAEEADHFDFSAVVDSLVAKLVRRHPHVFPDGQLRGERASGPTSEAAIRQRWEEIKAQERREKRRGGALADIPLALPALTRAQKLQARASRAGFDWHPSPGSQRAIIGVIRGELDELERAMAVADRPGEAEELGDLLFSVVNLARHLALDAEAALRGSNDKFSRRYLAMERRLAVSGTQFSELDEAARDALWERAKRD